MLITTKYVLFYVSSFMALNLLLGPMSSADKCYRPSTLHTRDIGFWPTKTSYIRLAHLEAQSVPHSQQHVEVGVTRKRLRPPRPRGQEPWRRLALHTS